jgi:hypothetical protein
MCSANKRFALDQRTVFEARNRAMNTDLNPVVAALAELDDGELATLINATHNVPQTAPGLLAWIERA